MLNLTDEDFMNRLAESLKALVALKNAGILTEEEFEIKFTQIIEQVFAS